MDKVSVAYSTTCLDKRNGTILMEREVEAINKDEAEARALLNCLRAGNKLDDVTVDAKRKIL